MSEKLKAAFIAKEKAEFYLTNLDKLKADKFVDESQYNVLKQKYSKLRDEAILKTNAIKADFKKVLDVKLKEVAVAKLNHKYLEIRYKVGEIPASTFSRQESGPKKKIAELEKSIADLQKLYNAKSSSEFTTDTNVKLFGFNLDLGKKERTLPSSTIPSEINLQPEVSQQESTQPDFPSQIIKPINLPPPAHKVSQFPAVKVESVEKIILAPPPIEQKPVEETIPEIKEIPKKVLPPGLIITDLQILPDRVKVGNHVGIVATIKNIGTEDIIHKIELKINGEIKDAADINLTPSRGDELTFIVLAGSPGNYTVDLDGQEGKYTVVSS